MYDNAAQLPAFIAQATGCFVQAGLGRDKDLLDAVTAPMLTQRVLARFSGRQIAQTMYNMFRLRYESPEVKNAITAELSRDSRVSEL